MATFAANCHDCTFYSDDHYGCVRVDICIVEGFCKYYEKLPNFKIIEEMKSLRNQVEELQKKLNRK